MNHVIACENGLHIMLALVKSTSFTNNLITSRLDDILLLAQMLLLLVTFVFSFYFFLKNIKKKQNC